MTKEQIAEIRDAEEWFNNSKYGKGRIAGFVTQLMVDYAKYYHNRQKTEPSRTCDTMEEFAKSQKSESKEESGIIHEILSECPKSKQNP